MTDKLPQPRDAQGKFLPRPPTEFRVVQTLVEPRAFQPVVEPPRDTPRVSAWVLIAVVAIFTLCCCYVLARFGQHLLIWLGVI